MAMMLLLFVVILVTRSESTSSPAAASFYDVLGSYSLPVGLFPKGISDFFVDPSSGSFRLHLMPPSPCHAKFETRVRYQGDISGRIDYGRIDNLTGVAAEDLFLWLPVNRIQVDVPSSGLIYFDVGLVSKQFSLSFFETPKDCSVQGKEYDQRSDVVLLEGNRVRIVESKHATMLRDRSMDEDQRPFLETAI